jgi:hypothetical protein
MFSAIFWAAFAVAFFSGIILAIIQIGNVR